MSKEYIMTPNEGHQYTEDEQCNFHSYDDRPAVVKRDGSLIWMKNGVKHRDTKDTNGKQHPAVLRPDGTKEWLVDGKLHNLDGPALITYDENNVETRMWYKRGLQHCEAINPETGYTYPAQDSDHNPNSKMWMFDDNEHRADKHHKTGLTLPAVMLDDGFLGWFNHGNHHNSDVDPITLTNLPAEIYPPNHGCLKIWYQNDYPMRKDGLYTQINEDGEMLWTKHTNLHAIGRFLHDPEIIYRLKLNTGTGDLILNILNL